MQKKNYLTTSEAKYHSFHGFKLPRNKRLLEKKITDEVIYPCKTYKFFILNMLWPNFFTEFNLSLYNTGVQQKICSCY